MAALERVDRDALERVERERVGLRSRLREAFGGLGGRCAVGERARGSLGGQRTSWVQDLPLSCFVGGGVSGEREEGRERFRLRGGT